MNKPSVDSNERLLKLHRLHLGLYARVAKKLSVNASYVSRVAQGKRENDRIREQLFKELRKINR